MKNLIEKKDILNEYAFSRLYSNMKNKTVGLISAYRKSQPTKINKRNQEDLKKQIKKHGLGWNEITGYYIESGENEAKPERTLVIYSNETKEDMAKWLVPLGQKYNQDSILIVVDLQGYLIGAAGGEDIKPWEEINIGQFTASKLGDIYSKRGKDTFVFESVSPDTFLGAYARKNKKDLYITENDTQDIVLTKLLKKLEIMENKIMNDYKIQLEDGVFVEVNSADYTDLVDANFETSIGDYGVARNPQTGVTIIGAVPGDGYYKAFEMRTITLDDVKDALDSVSDGFYAFLGVEPASYDSSLTEENLANAIMDLNQYEGYFQPAVFEMPQGLAEDGIVAIEEEPVAESKNESLDEVANTKAKSLNGKKVMFDDLGNPVTPEEWAEGIANGTINEAKLDNQLTKEMKDFLAKQGLKPEDFIRESPSFPGNFIIRQTRTALKAYNDAIKNNIAIWESEINETVEGRTKNESEKLNEENTNKEGAYINRADGKYAVHAKKWGGAIKYTSSLDAAYNYLTKKFGIDRKDVEYIKESVTEAFESDTDNKALALEDYFVNAEGEDPSEVEIKSGYTDNLYDTPWGEYYVFGSYGEAKQAAIEYEKQILDEIGIGALNWDYMPYEIGHYVDRDWFQDAMEESNQSYIDDIRDEAASSDEFESRLEEEMADTGVETEEDYLEHLNNNYADPIDWYKDNFGEEDFGRIAVEKNLVDLDAVAEDVIETDGLANVLAGYDGDEIEWEFNGRDYYIYKNS